MIRDIGKTVVTFIAGAAIGWAVSNMASHTEKSSEELPLRAADALRGATPHDASSDAFDSRDSWVGQEGLRGVAGAIEKGTGSIFGNVRTLDGQPLLGVVVETRPLNLPRSASRNAMSSSNETSHLQVITGKRGEFVFVDLADGPYDVTASLDGYEIVPLWDKASSVRPDARVDFVARVVQGLQVRVVFDDRREPDDAFIEYRSDHRRPLRGTMTWTPENRSLELSPGRYYIHATGGPSGEFRSDDLVVMVEPHEVPDPITLVLNSRPGVRGRILFSTGDVMDSVVYALQWSSNEEPSERQILTGSKTTTASAGDNYRFQLLDLVAGRYVIAASRVPDRVEVIDELLLTDQVIDRDLTLPGLDPATYLLLWAFGPKGEVLRDIEIMAGYRTDSASSSGDGRWHRQEDGAYVVFHHRYPAEDKSLRYYVTVISERYGQKEVEYALPETHTLEVHFSEPAFLDVLLSGYQGSGAEGLITVDLFRIVDERSLSEVEAERGLEGRVRFGPSVAGVHELVFSSRSSRQSAVSFRRMRFPLEPGQNERTVEAPRFHALRVSVGERFRDMDLSLDQEATGPIGGFRARLPVGASIVDFGRIPEGDYVLRCTPNEQMTLALTESTLVEFAPRTVDALSVSIFDSSGTLAEMGLQDGDVIVAIDGQEFRDLDHIRELLAAVRERESVDLRLRRGGEFLQIGVSPSFYWRAEGSGGRLSGATR